MCQANVKWPNNACCEMMGLHVKFPTLEEVAGQEGMGYKAYAFCINIIMTTWFYNRK